MNFEQVVGSVVDKSKCLLVELIPNYELYKYKSMHHLLFASEEKMRYMDCTDGQWLKGRSQDGKRKLFQLKLSPNCSDGILCSPFLGKSFWSLIPIIAADVSIPYATEVHISMVKKLNYHYSDKSVLEDFFAVDRVYSVHDFIGIPDNSPEKYPVEITSDIPFIG